MRRLFSSTEGSRKVEPSAKRKLRSPSTRARDLRRAVAHMEKRISLAEDTGDYGTLRELRARMVADGRSEDLAYAGTVSRIDLILYRVLGTGHWRDRRQYESRPPGGHR